jgi:hypothetical protein
MGSYATFVAVIVSPWELPLELPETVLVTVMKSFDGGGGVGQAGTLMFMQISHSPSLGSVDAETHWTVVDVQVSVQFWQWLGEPGIEGGITTPVTAAPLIPPSIVIE